MAAGTTMRYQGVLVRLAASLIDGAVLTVVGEALFTSILKGAPFGLGGAPRPGLALLATVISLAYLVAMEAT
jgi:hypothetical protein